MEEIKKIVKGLTPTNATYVNCGFALLLIVFFLFLPVVSLSGRHGGSVGFGASKLFSAGALYLIITLGVIGTALAIGLWPVLKRTINYNLSKIFTLAFALIALFLPTLFKGTMGFDSEVGGVGIGIGAILCILLAVAWAFFSYYRKDEPTYLDQTTKK